MVERSNTLQTAADPFGDLGNDPGTFLEDNLGLIIKTTRKKFGDVFSIQEVMSDAFEAWHDMKEYHSIGKNTKQTTSYTWFLNRRLDISYKTGITQPLSRSSAATKELERGDSHDVLLDRESYSTFFSRDDSAELGQEEQLYYHDPADELDQDLDFPDEHGNGQKEAFAYVPKYVICLESFHECLDSSDLIGVLKALSDKNAPKNQRLYKKLLARRRSVKRVSELIRQHLVYEVSKAGYHLYIAVCLNGSCNNILVAAKSEEQARSYLPAFGRLMEIRRFDLPRVS